MPGNPYIANPYSQWSVSGLLTYREVKILNDISTLICCNNYLADWRSGAYLFYKYLWVQPQSTGFHSPVTQVTIEFAGSFGYCIMPEYLAKYRGMLIFRKSALEMPEAFSPDVEPFLRDVISSTSKVSLLYDASAVKVYYFH